MKKWSGERAWSVVCEKPGKDNWIIQRFDHDNDEVQLGKWLRPINLGEIGKHVYDVTEVLRLQTDELEKWYVVFAY